MTLSNYTNKFPLEFCAAKFLHQWDKREESLFKAISARPTKSDIKKALQYFQVARSFKGLGLKNNELTAFEITNILDDVRTDPSLDTPESKVDALANHLHTKFEKLTISAATKLLWLSYRSPYVIYDSRALNALKNKAGEKKLSKDYGAYARAWRNAYISFETPIESAILNLKDGRKFMPETSRPDDDFISLSKESWFKERVFDVFLWELGGDS